MNLNFLNNIFVIHLKNILMLFIGVMIVIIASFVIILDTRVSDLNNQINMNIENYSKINLNFLCKLSNCDYIYVDNAKSVFKFQSNNKFSHTIKKLKKTHIHEDLYILGNNISFYNKQLDAYIAINIQYLIVNYLQAITIFAPLILLVFMIPLINSIIEEKNNNLIKSAGNEAILSNQSMISIAENIHHELNTPLEVIDNKIDKIYNFLRKFVEDEENIERTIGTLPKDRLERNTKLKDIVKNDFEYIKTSSEQIYTVLSKMKTYKHLRYSNGNKSIYNIVEGAFKIIEISNSNFNYKIDVNLKQYGLFVSLKNAELLSVLINHLKNSLEANSNIIHVILSKKETKFIKIRIIDNGNGIPEDVIKKIFEPNFSTKNIEGVIRGNGMYLNKQILKAVGGNIKLIDTSVKGTTIEITVPIKKEN